MHQTMRGAISMRRDFLQAAHCCEARADDDAQGSRGWAAMRRATQDERRRRSPRVVMWTPTHDPSRAEGEMSVMAATVGKTQLRAQRRSDLGIESPPRSRF